MEFIKAEEFLGQPVEVQKVLLEWWKKNATEFDLLGYIGKSKAYQNSFPSLVRNVAIDCFELMVEIIPLFSEGQLRQFIEDKTGCNINISYKHKPKDGCLELEFDFYEFPTTSEYIIYISTKNIIASNILEAWWKLAIEIVKSR